MSRSFLITLLFIITITASAQSPVQVTHYRYELELNDANDSIVCTAYIRCTATDTTRSVRFNLTGINKKKQGMMVTAVSFAGKEKAATGFIHNNDLVTVHTPQPLKAGDTITVAITYKGIPADGLIISKNKYGHRTFFADNWPDRGHNWLVCVDEPAAKAAVEYFVTAPQHYKVVANGLLITEDSLAGNRKRTHWKEEVPIPPKVMVIGVADFAVDLAGKAGADSIPVSSWVYPEDRDKGFYDYAQAVTILPFYMNYVGPYGYKKLANVQSKTTFGGLENANTIFYHENSITGTRRSESLMAHEIAHQWFGNMATERTFAHLWLSEGFATYMTILYMEHQYGADTATKMLREDRGQVIAFAKESKNPVVDTVSSYMNLLNANSYQKGGWVLHMLRKQLGDSVFHESIRNYYAAYAGKNADTRNLQAVFEKTSGKDLAVFFQQWLYTPGIPVLKIGWSYNAKTKKARIVIQQTQPSPFVFPLELEFETASGVKQRKTLLVNKAAQTFLLPLTARPATVVADPATALLFEAGINPIP